MPICRFCKKITNDENYWQQVEDYVAKHSEADFSHGICPEWREKHYPTYVKRRKHQTAKRNPQETQNR